MTSVASVRVNGKARDASGGTTATRTHVNTMVFVQTEILVPSVLATDMMVRAKLKLQCLIRDMQSNLLYNFSI